MAAVDLVDVRKAYGEHEVIHGVSIGISDGEFVALVGPSGCGKSTLLRMIAGLEPITKGDIKIDSKIVNDLEPKDRDIAMVFQNYALYPHKNVSDNMGFALQMRRVPKQQIAERVRRGGCRTPTRFRRAVDPPDPGRASPWLPSPSTTPAAATRGHCTPRWTH